MGNQGKVVLITGASSGIGKAIAELLGKRNLRVYGTSRKQPLPNGNSAIFPKMVKMDVCNEDSVREAINYIMCKEGRIDILINNAGNGMAGAIEETTIEEALHQFDTNFFGVLRVCKQVIPIMREQKKGLIINISSIAGLIAVPFQAMYSASKAALELTSDALRMEIKPFGIGVVLVEPGDTKTGFTANREIVSDSNSSSVYISRFNKSLEAMTNSELNAPGPEAVAISVGKIIDAKNLPTRVVVGFTNKVIVCLVKKILPDSLGEYIVEKLLGIR